MASPTEDDRKIREFIARKGVTGCQQAARAEFNPASMVRSDDRRFNPFSGSVSGDTPERRLAQAKLFRMFQDLTGVCHVGDKGSKEAVRQRAHRWFFGEGDFEEWCLMAGYAPDYVRKHTRLVAEQGLAESRLPRGQGKRREYGRKYRERMKRAVA